jgi:hypothetical protein
MNSVDTGWVTDEDPARARARARRVEHPRFRFHPPLDIVDGAARIVDPDHRPASTPAPRLGPVPEGLLVADAVPVEATGCRCGRAVVGIDMNATSKTTR